MCTKTSLFLLHLVRFVEQACAATTICEVVTERPANRRFDLWSTVRCVEQLEGYPTSQSDRATKWRVLAMGFFGRVHFSSPFLLAQIGYLRLVYPDYLLWRSLSKCIGRSTPAIDRTFAHHFVIYEKPGRVAKGRRAAGRIACFV